MSFKTIFDTYDWDTLEKEKNDLVIPYKCMYPCT